MKNLNPKQNYRHNLRYAPTRLTNPQKRDKSIHDVYIYRREITQEKARKAELGIVRYANRASLKALQLVPSEPPRPKLWITKDLHETRPIGRHLFKDSKIQ